jgi:transcriptional activator of cad operon
VKAGSRVVSVDDLLRDVWRGRVFDDGIVYKKINQLRRALGDDRRTPRLIETIPKRGYRLVAAVWPATTDEASESVDKADATTQASPATAVSDPLARRVLWAAAGRGAAIAAAALLASGGTTPEGINPAAQSRHASQDSFS